MESMNAFKFVIEDYLSDAMFGQDIHENKNVVKTTIQFQSNYLVLIKLKLSWIEPTFQIKQSNVKRVKVTKISWMGPP